MGCICSFLPALPARSALVFQAREAAPLSCLPCQHIKVLHLRQSLFRHPLSSFPAGQVAGPTIPSSYTVSGSRSTSRLSQPPTHAAHAGLVPLAEGEDEREAAEVASSPEPAAPIPRCELRGVYSLLQPFTFHFSGHMYCAIVMAPLQFSHQHLRFVFEPHFLFTTS